MFILFTYSTDIPLRGFRIWTNRRPPDFRQKFHRRRRRNNCKIIWKRWKNWAPNGRRTNFEPPAVEIRRKLMKIFWFWPTPHWDSIWRRSRNEIGRQFRRRFYAAFIIPRITFRYWMICFRKFGICRRKFEILEIFCKTSNKIRRWIPAKDRRRRISAKDRRRIPAKIRRRRIPAKDRRRRQDCRWSANFSWSWAICSTRWRNAANRRLFSAAKQICSNSSNLIKILTKILWNL